MCDPFAAISTGLQIVGAVQERSAANKAAAAADRAANFNADIIERDIDLLEKTRGIMNENFLVMQNRFADAFEREIQGTARAGFGYSGVDMSVGTPVAVMLQNAREFDFEQSQRALDNTTKNMQIDDEQEGLQMAADLARMEGGATAAGLRAQGTSSLIRSFANVATTVYENPGDFKIS